MESKAQENLPGMFVSMKPQTQGASGKMQLLINQSGEIVKQIQATGVFEKYSDTQQDPNTQSLKSLFIPAQHPHLERILEEASVQNTLEATLPWEGKSLKLSFHKDQNHERPEINLNLSIQDQKESNISYVPADLPKSPSVLNSQAPKVEEALFYIDEQGCLSLANQTGRLYVCNKLKYCEGDKPLFVSLWPSKIKNFWQENLSKLQLGRQSSLIINNSQLPQHPLFESIVQVRLSAMEGLQTSPSGIQIQFALGPADSSIISNAFLDALMRVNSLEWAIWAVDANLKLLFANDVAKNFKLKGLGQAITFGKNIADFWPKEVSDKNLVAYRKALTGESVEVVRNEKTKLPYSWAKINLEPIWKDGKVLGVLGTGRFIDEQKKTEANLREANAYKTTLLNSSNQRIWAVDRNYKLLFYNTYHAQMNQRILGRDLKIGDSVLDYTNSEAHRQSAQAYYDMALKGQRSSSETCIIDKDGKEIWSEFDFNPIFDDEQILGVMVVARDITERKLTEKKLIESENSLKEAQAIAGLGNWSYDKLENKHYWSQEMRSIFGLSQEDPVPNYEQFIEFIIPQDRPKVKKLIGGLMQEEKTFRQNYCILSRDGKQKFVLVHAKSVMGTDGTIEKIVGVVQDVTKTRNIELELRNQKEFLENLINNLPIAVFVKDIEDNFRLSTWNRKCEEIYGIPKEEALGKNDFDLFDEATAQENNQHDEDILYKEKIIFQDQLLIPREDKTVYVRQVKVPIKDVNGKPRFILGIEEDISERLQKEKELILAKEKAEEATQAKSDFLATMSHEIRTPLNAVVGITNLLIEESLHPEQLDKIQALKFSAKSLLNIINDILDYNKIEAGKVELEQTEFSLLELCRNIKHTYEYQAQGKGIQLKLILDDDIPATLLGDSTRIFQILNNLVSNAVKFTEEGSVKLTVHQEQDHDDKVRVFFSIKDTGIGIPPNKQKIIFDRYTQSGEDTTRRFGGSGLGLAICKGLLELLGSDIQLESELGKGSQFSFYLDLHKTRNVENKGANKAEIQDWNGLKRARVLVAEDNPVNQFVIQGYLKKWHIDFEFANDGQEALLKLQESEFDLILMDLQMPEMNGLDAARTIRNLGADNFRDIPIIALTASASSEVRNKVEQIGMNDYVSKPFQPKDLYTKMLKYYSQHDSVSYTYPHTQATGSTISSTLEPSYNLAKYFEITHDDPEMYTDLLKLTFREFNNFMVDYREAMEQRDINRIRSLVHKSSPTMQLLEFNGLIEESRQGKFILTHPNPPEDWISDNIKEVERYCLSLLNELSQKANVNSSQDLLKV